MKITDEIRLGIAEIADHFGLSLVVRFKDGDPGLSRTLDVQGELSNLFRERDFASDYVKRIAS